ncbi:hypothetical protein SLEP1_g31730 [Rubroshorea leprosula]|uniref:Uncharacterized protein n=1 Tax=Rubroshorea leprosula TaxID=152421 RepID=A0AAV5K476_9ROSI|nr:hypothetical protein SLEP1_g31730 [Rubroshorea leprosula]
MIISLDRGKYQSLGFDFVSWCPLPSYCAEEIPRACLMSVEVCRGFCGKGGERTWRRRETPGVTSFGELQVAVICCYRAVRAALPSFYWPPLLQL